MTDEQEMNAGRACLAARDRAAAYRHFQTAHDLGHPVQSKHWQRSKLATALVISGASCINWYSSALPPSPRLLR